MLRDEEKYLSVRNELAPKWKTTDYSEAHRALASNIFHVQLRLASPGEPLRPDRSINHQQGNED